MAFRHDPSITFLLAFTPSFGSWFWTGILHTSIFQDGSNHSLPQYLWLPSGWAVALSLYLLSQQSRRSGSSTELQHVCLTEEVVWKSSGGLASQPSTLFCIYSSRLGRNFALGCWCTCEYLTFAPWWNQLPRDALHSFTALLALNPLLA